ncbi:hypothetical protein H6G96_16460 [Nostoc sp. FACHB-892]|uniref:hypothetical protein n=1 Tax=Nostoc sp. FACHB-892 TaxID=2692843 RepID=UPI0016846352|nr:hypothetical protein [Nostoc sp. FACHB-892]MBD2727872.1 hypothetical protein [Nostoc sp. FACHB-892]
MPKIIASTSCFVFSKSTLSGTIVNFIYKFDNFKLSIERWTRLFSNGDRLLQQQFLIGLAILTVLALIPFFRGLVVFLVNLFGLGVILLWQFGR